MYTFVAAIRELLPKLNNTSDATIRAFIKRASSKIDQRIGNKWFIPIQANANESGTITLDNSTTVVTGTSTEFSTKLNYYDYISVDNVIVRVASVTNDTTLTLTNNPEYSITDGSYFIMPNEICTATEYMTASMLLGSHFSNQAYNQETINYMKEYKALADEDIKSFMENAYYNSYLKPAIKANGFGRIPYWSRKKTTTETDIPGEMLTEIYTTIENNY